MYTLGYSIDTDDLIHDARSDDAPDPDRSRMSLPLLGTGLTGMARLSRISIENLAAGSLSYRPLTSASASSVPIDLNKST